MPSILCLRTIIFSGKSHLATCLAPLEPHPASSKNKTVLAPYYPEKLRDQSDDQLYMAIAESENAANPQGATALESALKAYAPAQAGFYAALGDAYAKSGGYAQAVTWFEEARKRNPENRVILGKMVERSCKPGNWIGRRNAGERGRQATGGPGILANLGNVYARQGQLRRLNRRFNRLFSWIRSKLSLITCWAGSRRQKAIKPRRFDFIGKQSVIGPIWQRAIQFGARSGRE